MTFRLLLILSLLISLRSSVLEALALNRLIRRGSQSLINLQPGTSQQSQTLLPLLFVPTLLNLCLDIAFKSPPISVSCRA